MRDCRFGSRLRRWAVLTVLGFLTTGGMVVGQEPPRSSDDALQNLERALDNESALSDQTKSAFKSLIAMIRSERDENQARSERWAAQQAAKQEAFEVALSEYSTADSFVGKKAAYEKFFTHVKFFGDLRLRHESSFDLDDLPDRNRQRERVRLGANLALHDELTLGLRLATGSVDDPNSPHVTLGQVFNKFDFSLDRAFITYRPKWAEGAYLTAGKFGHPFHADPVYGENVWDDDVQPEGLVVGYRWKGDGFIEKIDFVAGVYDVLEIGGGDDTYAAVGQVAVSMAIADALKSVLAIGYYAYSDPTPERNPAILVGDNAGNATVDRDGNGTVDDFASQFGILNPILSLTYSGLDGWPIVVAGEFIWNTEAAVSEDIGYGAGFSVGQAKSAGDWRFDYKWQVVQRDAVFSPVSQDDFLLQTNHRSHLFGVNYQAADTIGLRLWFLVSRPDEVGATATTDSDDYQWRLRLDLNIRF